MPYVSQDSISVFFSEMYITMTMTQIPSARVRDVRVSWLPCEGAGYAGSRGILNRAVSIHVYISMDRSCQEGSWRLPVSVGCLSCGDSTFRDSEGGDLNWADSRTANNSHATYFFHVKAT